MIPDYHELSIFTYQEICEAGGIELKPPSALGRECMRAAKWLSKLLRHVGNKHCEPQGRYRFDDSAYGLPLDSGCWFLWKHILEVGKEAIPQHGMPSKRSFCVFDACALASFGDRDKARFQFAVMLSALRHKRPKSRYERYVEVCGMRAMSGHIGNPWTKTPRYATRIKPGDEKWMSVLSHNTTLTNLDSIFTTGLVLFFGGGYEKDSNHVQSSSTCRSSALDSGVGKVASNHNVVLVMHKGGTCKTSELYQVATSVVLSPTSMVPRDFDRAWAGMQVPRLMKTTGTWCWEREWCIASDERLVTPPITGYMIVPTKTRYIDPDFEDDFREAIAMGEEWSVICAWRALKLGLAGRPVRHCLACGKLHVVGKGILLDQALSRVLPLQWCWQVQYMRRSNQRG